MVITEALVGIVAVVLVSLLLGWRAATARASLSDYYLADQSLSQGESAHLLWASSLSLNGLFYHTWLGYKIGVYSLAIQAIWCGGYLFLARFPTRLHDLTQRDSLPGNIRTKYGPAAGILAAFASIWGFIALSGWEMAVATTFSTTAFDFTPSVAVVVVVGLALLTSTYTVRGGLKGNLRANQFQNILKLIVFPIIIYAAFRAFEQSPEESVDTLKLSIADAVVGVGGLMALISNAAFSFFWQSADMSTWQNVSATTRRSNNPRRALTLGAIGIFISPGLFGTVMGMSLSKMGGLSDTDMLPSILAVVSDNAVLVAMLFAGLTAAMLSTLDGLFLAASMAFTWEVTHRKTVHAIIRGECQDSAQEDRVLAIGYLAVFAAAALGVGIFLLVQYEVLGLFETVYLAVVGQMSLAPVAVSLLMRRKFDSSGFVSIVGGLLAGVTFIALGIGEVPGPVDWVGTAPAATLGIAWVLLLISRRTTSSFGGRQ